MITLRRVIGARRSRRSAAPRDQAGYTLIELLLVIAISGLVLGPLLAWTVLVIRQQPVTRDGAIRTAQSGILQAYFPGDVLEAGAANLFSEPVPTTPAQWSTWRSECGSGEGRGGRNLVVMLTQGPELTKTIYSVAPMRDGGQIVPGRSSIWRSKCEANTGTLLSSTQVVEDVVDDPASTTATCWSPQLANGLDDADCRQVRLQVQTASAEDPSMPVGVPTTISASRRTDARSLDVDPTGNFLPVPRIVKLVEQRSAGTVRFVLDATTSTDSDGAGDGSDLIAQWELPTGPSGSGAPLRPPPGPLTDPSVGTKELILTEAGEYTVRLVITDAKGASQQTYRTLVVENLDPIAVATVTPDSTIAGVGSIAMSSAGSNDPDGAITAYSWRITSQVPAAEGLEWEFTTAGEDISQPVPEWATGGLHVTLTVTDDWGTSVSRSSTVEVVDPLAPPPDPGPDPDPDPDPDPPVPGAPVAQFATTPGSGTTVSFDAGESIGSITSYSWNFGLLAGQGSGRTVSWNFPAPGTYTVVLTVTDDEGRTGTRTRTVVVPGAPTAPGNLRVVGTDLFWDARPGARRYLVDLESTGPGCARSLPDQAIAAVEFPRKALPPNPCPEGSTARARVGVEASAGGPVAYSGWIVLPAGPVVK